jgi:hypothetical protein
MGLCLRHEANSRLSIAHITDRGNPPPEAKKFNAIVAPLERLNGAFQLRWSDALYEELSGQELERYIKSNNILLVEDEGLPMGWYGVANG